MTAHRDVDRILVLHKRLDRLWADDRFTTTRDGVKVRHLAEALIWWSWHKVKDDGTWVARRLGYRDWNAVVTGPIWDDAPRFEPPDRRWASPCAAPLERGPRAGLPCGKHPNSSVRATDPATGMWRYEGYCQRHGAHLEAARIAERTMQTSGSLPEPLPNTGGLLPCHTPITNWPDLYSGAQYGQWKPPRVGIRADDWPTLAKVEAKAPPKLVLIHGRGGDPCGHDDLIAAGRIFVDGIDATPRRPAPLALVRGDDDADR